MLEIEWRDEYRIDEGIIDEEHKSLIEMANQIFTIEHPESRREELIELVKNLFRYMEYHFEHEEDIMEQARVPDREAHARKHRILIEEMTRALKTHTDLREYTVELRRLVSEWFVKHIVRVDTQMAERLRNAAR